MARWEHTTLARAAALAVAAVALCLGLGACGSGSSAGSPAAAVISGASASASSGSQAIAVSPQPGTPDASPTTQISFLGPKGTTVSSVRVVGSRSHTHTGVLRAYSTGTGESFLPSHPFIPGERVSVSAQVQAGGGAHAVRTSFTVAHQAPVAQAEFPLEPGNAKDVQHFSTAPALTPSTVQITTPARAGAAPGYLLLAPYQGLGTPGPMIAEQDGQMVWFDPLPKGVESTSLRVQSYEGQPVLTWWQGRILELGFGQGEDVIYNSHYRRIATVHAGNGYHADLHEFRLTPEGTAWIDAFDPIYANLTSVHGSADGTLSDSVIEEVDVKTGLVMWQWHALGHIPIGESHNPPPRGIYPWDAYHINSISPGAAAYGQEGDVLLSSRNTWTLYDVNIASGSVLWRLGGEHSSFKLGPGTRTYWQHDAEWQPGGLISVFDNGSYPPEEKQSRGLVLAPDLAAHRVTLAKALTNPTKTLLASSQGDMLPLAGGDWMMGYGGLPNFTEYTSSGHVLLDGTLGKGVQDFRTYLSPWSGQPPGAPSVVAKPASGGAISVSVSWNGATEVSSWKVLAGSSPSSLAAVTTAPRSGFQTTIAASAAGPFVQVQALSSSGAVLGTSAAVKD